MERDEKRRDAIERRRRRRRRRRRKEEEEGGQGERESESELWADRVGECKRVDLGKPRKRAHIMYLWVDTRFR